VTPPRIDGARASLTEDAAAATQAAAEHLLSLQHADGWWKGELETNVTMDAEDLMLRHFLGRLEGPTAESSARWIRSNQQADGTWATFHGGPPDVSTTIEAYVALRLAGDAADAPHMMAAAEWVRQAGGVGSARVFTRIWLAMLGQWKWTDLPVLPAEIMFLPSGVPLNIYDFACWARQTVVALTVVMAYRPVHPLPFSLDELMIAGPAAPRAGGFFGVVDRVLHRYERLPGWFLPRTALRKAALARAERWIIQRQESDGLWGGIQPPVVYSIIALHLLGYPLDHPALGAALAGLDGFTSEDERGRRLEACQSPVWDTALAVIGLADAGITPDHPAMRAAAEWLTGEEVTVPGDWSVRRPGLAPGGWAFEFANDHYPDIDDTAEVVLALRRLAHEQPAARDACDRAVTWTLGMRSSSGAWAAFDADNVSRMVAALPFCDFGEVTDPPSADVTAHVVEMLAAEADLPPGVLDKAVDWLWSEQEPDGSWFGRWGVNYIYGTGAVVPALVAAGVDPSDRRLRRAVEWLTTHQNEDGGWGEDLRSYVDRSWRGRGTSTASQTAWALLALIATGDATSDAATKGVEWLIRHQTPEGTWDEPEFTGTGFPWDFSINYHLYRLVWPLSALGRWKAAVATSGVRRHRTVLLAGPRSFCAGVDRAIATVERAIDLYGAPVYVRRQIVHNRHVVEDLQARGAVFVQELSEVPEGSVVILSAHGVSRVVREEAAGRELTVIDATCPLVSKVHHEVRRFSEKGYQIVMIGHPGHDETEGTLGEAAGISLVTTPADVAALEVADPDRLAYITQTTLSPDDVAAILTELSDRYPSIVGPHAADICYATQNRQDAVSAIAAECDAVLVVGSTNSSNAARLVEVAARAGCPAYLIEDETGLDAGWLNGADTVGITAAASTPAHLVDRVVEAITALGGATIIERSTRTENVNFPLPVEVR
jgi:squalene-hopene/tetraprenyl-beta-curcumene cyclase